MIRILFITVAVCFLSLTVFAKAADAAPKTDMRINEPWIQTSDDGFVFTVVYPSATLGKVECTSADLDGQSWREMFRNLQQLGPVPLSTFIASLPPPPGAVRKTTDPVVQARCAAIRDLMVVVPAPIPPPPAVPALYIIVATIAGQADRPLYNDQFSSIGRVEFMLNGAPRVCEPTPIYKTGSTVKYYWVTNNANQRGLAVCKPQ